MAGWRTSSTWMKIALVCICLALLLFVIGFATVSWATGKSGYRGGYYTENDFGLWKWKSCTSSSCSESKNPQNARGWRDWYRATQAMECIGLICLVVATFILFVYMFVASFKRRNAIIACIVLTFAAVLFIIIGVAIFASKFEDIYGYSVGWSMGLAIAAAILAFVAGIMEVIELK